MILEENKDYTLKELGHWFGSKSDSYLYRLERRREKFKELENFANFEWDEVKKVVHIIEVYNPVYEKKSKQKENDKFYKKAIVEVIEKAPLQYYKTVTGRIVQICPEEIEKMHHTFSTSYNYVRKNMKQMFITEETHGKVVEKIWCRRYYGAEYDFIPITEEQKKLWNKLISDLLGNEEYQQELASLLSAKDRGELSPKECAELSFHLSSCQWNEIKAQFCDVYGFIPESVMKFELNAWVDEK